MPHESERVLRALRAEIERTVGELQAFAFQAVTSGTPVDTNFARAQWAPSFQRSSDEGVARPRDRGEAKTRAAAEFQAHKRQSQQIRRSYQLSLGPVYISNNANYIGFLNGGSSSQAPSNFVEAAIAEAVQRVESG